MWGDSKLGFTIMILAAQVERCKASERQSKRVVRELKSVLVILSCSSKISYN